MAVVTRHVEVRSRAENDVVDLTKDVQEAVEDSGLKYGIATVFVTGSTAAVTTMEYEPGLVEDFPGMLERVSPRGISYEHQKTWHDDNGRSHVKASLVGPSLSVPFVDGLLTLGTWQQVVFVEYDTPELVAFWVSSVMIYINDQFVSNFARVVTITHKLQFQHEPVFGKEKIHPRACSGIARSELFRSDVCDPWSQHCMK